MGTDKILPINAKIKLTILVLIIVAEIGSIAVVAKTTFSSGLLSAIILAFLFSGEIAFLTHFVLQKISIKYKQQLLKAVWCSGCVLVVLGFIGTCLLFLPITSCNLNILLAANILLMIGLTLGIPLVATAMYEDTQMRKIVNDTGSNLERSIDSRHYPRK